MTTFTKILLASAFGLFAMILIRRYFGVEALAKESSAIATFLGVFGTIYAIIVGFTLLIVINRFSALSSATDEESNGIGDVLDLLNYVDNQPQTVKLITEKLHAYLHAIVMEEWEGMKRGEYSGKTSQAILGLIQSVNQIKVTNPSDQTALDALINKMISLTTWRARRVSLASQSLPPLLLYAVAVLSMALTTGFLFLVVTNFWIQAFIIVSVITAIVLLYALVDDMNHPFVGMWNISKKPYERLMVDRF